MWKIISLVAVDEETGGRVAIEDNRVKIATVADSVTLFRRVKLKETPPHLSVAIDDLLKLITEEKKKISLSKVGEAYFFFAEMSRAFSGRFFRCRHA